MSGQQAAKAALKEVKKQKHVYTFKGEKFEFPATTEELPGRAMRAMQKGDSLDAIYLLMGEDEARFDALNPSLADLKAFDTWFGEVYGFESAGESRASKDS